MIVDGAQTINRIVHRWCVDFEGVTGRLPCKTHAWCGDVW